MNENQRGNGSIILKEYDPWTVQPLDDMTRGKYNCQKSDGWIRMNKVIKKKKK